MAAQLQLGARRLFLGEGDVGWAPDSHAPAMVGSSFIIGGLFVAPVGAGLGYGAADVLGIHVRGVVPAFRFNVGAAF